MPGVHKAMNGSGNKRVANGESTHRPVIAVVRYFFPESPMRSVLITLLVWLAAPAAIVPAQSLQEQFRLLTQEYKSTADAWHEKYNDAIEDEESIARYRDWPGWTFAPRFVAFGERAGASSEGFESVCELLKMGNSVGEFDRELFTHYERALELLLSNHWEKDLRPLCAQVGVSDGSERFLRTLIDKSDSTETRAEACFHLGRLLVKKREMCLADSWARRPPVGRFAEYVRERTIDNLDSYIRDASSDRLYAEAKGCFDRVVADYRNVVTHPNNATLGDRARLELFELEHLSVGRIAPGIDGRDLAGDSMKLSDFRGQVVLLVFWASWCGPCMGDIPHEKELHSKFAGRPFAIVGVNADETLESAKKAVEANAIPWRSYWNGKKDSKGSMAVTWNVRAWPTVYVLDESGVIRHKHLRRNELDGPLEQLIVEAETANSKRK